MWRKPLDQITPEDLRALVGVVSEHHELEFKEALPDDSRKGRIEFLRDVTSFANAIGGYLIYGIRDKRENRVPTGIAEAIVGLGKVNAGSVILTLENVIRDGVQPHLHVSTRAIACEGVSVIILYVPRSDAGPHMVMLGGDDGFYTRMSAGRKKLSVDEIRNAFLESESLGERLRAFRRGRIARIVAGDTPAPLEAGPRLVIHLVPFSADSGIGRVTVPMMESQSERLRPIVGRDWDPSYNYDGFASISSRDPKRIEACGYVQVFRTGALEAVDCLLLQAGAGGSRIPGATFETRMVEFVGQYLDVQRDLGISPPIVVTITLLGVRGFTMSENDDPWLNRAPQPINRDEVALPEEVVNEYGARPPQELLRHAFDVLWQTAGWPGSLYRNADGSWKPDRR